ncbi:helix-turn-helix transcriptional regulator [Paenibacillus alvei]|uniref:helix-turn-helix transcriptional regulator n=1 Tax=Paenibacillus alvei TaxID=44250 RepID=UPI0013D90119|nr:helix-turn-helix transcriptional regulator [Paenibacillus alvei]NEZ40739.1 helix-turn-helix domain-containing protein [Paenibacillus alvei]
MTQNEECPRPYLKKLRRSTGTQRVVAQELDITEQHLRSIEKGSTAISIKLLFKMANYFNASIYELFPDLNNSSFYDS